MKTMTRKERIIHIFKTNEEVRNWYEQWSITIQDLENADNTQFRTYGTGGYGDLYAQVMEDIEVAA